MTLKNFAKTHNKKPKEIVALLKDNIDKVNSDDEHAKFVDDEWHFDDETVDFFDALLKKSEAILVFPEPAFLRPQENIVSQDETALLKKQILNLQESLQLAQDNAKAKDEEYKNLQARILSYEDGASSINGDLIRKYQQKSDRLEKELAQTQADLLKLWKTKSRNLSPLLFNKKNFCLKLSLFLRSVSLNALWKPQGFSNVWRVG